MLSGITSRLCHTPKTLRVLSGLSQKRLALRAGVAVNTVAAIESGADVSTRKLELVASALGIPAWELMRARDAIGRPLAYAEAM